MDIMSGYPQRKYDIVTRLLHWLIAITIIGQIILAFVMENIRSPIRGQLYFVHKSLGLTLLLLAILFILWRLFHKKPTWPAAMPLWERIAARLVQFCLYALILIMPLSGWFMSTAAGYVPSFWGWFKIAAPIGKSPTAASFFDTVHTSCAWIICILIIIHILAALKHALIDKDNVLREMF